MAYSTYTEVYRQTGLTISDVSEANVTLMIAEVDSWIDDFSGRTYDSASAQTDYFDTLKNDYQKNWMNEGGIIVGTKPFFESRDQFVLRTKPVTQIDDVWILNKGADLNKVYSYDDSGSSYTDNTTEANSVGGTPFDAFASSVGTSDVLYIGCQYRFLAVTINLVTVGVGGVLAWEYYNGSDWTTLTVTEGTTDADDLNASGKMTWSLPRDWQSNEVDGDEFYWVRLVVSSAHTTSPTVRNIFMDSDTVIEEELNPDDYTWSTEGVLLLRNKGLNSDMKRLRVNYYAGMSSVPARTAELSSVLASIKCMINLMGQSYDDISGGGIGPESFQFGEPYTNLRATMVELYKRRDELMRLIGGNIVFLAS